MDTNVVIAIISGIFAILTAVLVPFLVNRQDMRKEKKLALKSIEQKYVNPLRLYLVECYTRLNEIKLYIERIEKGLTDSNKDSLDILIPINDFNEIKTKDDMWFNYDGCYLMSTCYLNACLFAAINGIYKGIPDINFGDKYGSEIMNALIKISIGFSGIKGIFYVLQFSIGNDMYDEDKIISYRDFCYKVKEEKFNIWLSKIVNFFLDIAKLTHNKDFYYLKKLDFILYSIENLLKILDKRGNIKKGTLEERNIMEEEYKKFKVRKKLKELKKI